MTPTIARFSLYLLLPGLVIVGGCRTTQPDPQATVPTRVGSTPGERASRDTGRQDNEGADQQRKQAGQGQAPSGAGTRKNDGNGSYAVRSGAPPNDLLAAARASVRSGQYENAIRQAKAALRRDEKFTPAMEVMARAYFSLGKLEFSSSICEIALRIESRSGRCHTLKGLVALRNEDQPGALAAFRKAVEVEPEYAPASLNLGAEYLRVKNYEKSVQALERVRRALDNRPEFHLNLGSAYRGRGDLQPAERAFRRALALKAEYPAAFFNLGILYLDAPKFPGMSTTRRLESALANFRRYLQVVRSRPSGDPVNTYIKAAERGLKKEANRKRREARKKAREAAKKSKTNGS